MGDSVSRGADETKELRPGSGMRQEFIAILTNGDFKPEGSASITLTDAGIWFHVELNAPASITAATLVVEGGRSWFPLFCGHPPARQQVIGLVPAANPAPPSQSWVSDLDVWLEVVADERLLRSGLLRVDSRITAERTR